eukprot:scaffold8500_cov20-Tisochrysis_lutea.AAC.2
MPSIDRGTTISYDKALLDTRGCFSKALLAPGLHFTGIKWSATKWIHVGHYANGGELPQHIERIIFVPPPPPVLQGCVDKNSM